jgi:general secretion pathway protein H
MKQRGLTLIEIMVAMTIAVVLFSAVAMSVGAITGSKAKAATGELAGTIRYLYDTASLTGKTCRLVFNLPSQRDEDAKVQYWAECASGNIATSRDREAELKEATQERDDRAKGKEPVGEFKDDSAFSELMAREENRVEDRAKFSDYTDEQVEKREFPTAVRVSVWTRHQKNETKDGLAYLYFFPQGFTERSMVKIRQGDNTWTIKISPLTGKANVVAEDVEIPRS